MRRLNPFRLNGLVTGIGSLPFTDPQAAVEFVAENAPEIPFWPQLPQRSPYDGMIEQTLYPFLELLQRREQPYGYYVKPGQLDLLIERLEQEPARFEQTATSGFFAFREALAAGEFKRATAVKGQLTGPITLLFQLFEGEQTLTGHQTLVSAVGRYITRLALWQAEQLHYKGLPVLIFVDEPCLGLFNKANFSPQSKPHLLQTLKALLVELEAAGVITGIHACAYPSLADINYLQPQILSFDAHEDLETFCGSAGARLFLENGGQVAFGLIPTWSDLSQFDPERQFYRWLLATESLLELTELTQRSLITATCGLALLDEKAARASFHAARYLSNFFERATFSLTVK